MINPGHVEDWAQRLLADPQALKYLREVRGLTVATIEHAGLGWSRGRYTLPVRDPDGLVVNVRLASPSAEPKVINLDGYGSPVRWYTPWSEGEGGPVIVAEGEWDCLLTGQEFGAAGLVSTCITGTHGAASIPTSAELERLRGRDVFIAYDCDQAGRRGARKLAGALESTASEIRVIELGLDEGQDLTDWFQAAGKTADDLWALMHTTPLWGPATGAGRRSADELLATAISSKVEQEGSRNAAGFWFACQLRDERYTEDEAVDLMLRFQSQVTALKTEPYTEREALASVESAFSQPARQAIGTVGAAYTLDDLGNAERFIAIHGRDFRNVPGYGGRHVWDASRWVLDHEGRAVHWMKQTVRAMRREAFALAESDSDRGKALSKHAHRSAHAGRIAAALKLAESEPGVTLPGSRFDADPRLLVCGNGVIELGDKGASFREYRREDYCRLLTLTNYEPAATAHRWRLFLHEILPDPETRRFLQTLAGYSLVGGNPERLLVTLIGPTSTGKTTLLEVLNRILGEYAGTFDLSLFRAKQDESPRADIVDAISKRLIFTSEASNAWRLHGDTIKRITGGDTIKARLPHSGTFVEKIPDFTPWIATNHPPRVHGVDQALWRRLISVPFDVSRDADASDPKLGPNIAANESAGVLAWAVEGWNLYRRNGLQAPPQVAAATMRMRDRLSDLDQWLAEETVPGSEHVTPFAHLWMSYSDWCILSEIPAHDRLSRNVFATELEGRGFAAKRQRAPGSDTKIRSRIGLTLRTISDASGPRVKR